jgi:alpha-amylase
MAPRISLALVLHNHQPVGNFGYVIAANHDAAYLPMIEALERHPEVRLGFHYTGPLLEWLRSERPDTVARLATLHQRGQVEIVGGGWCEPVLASLPERDRVGQLRRMASELATTFGERPRGAWLAERVWEPDVPTSLHDAGYAWTIVDDAHFRSAAIADDAMWGPYSTDDQGRRINVFGTEQGLRYRIPFGTVESVIEHLRTNATEGGERLGVMGDDGEKFGAWPTTWEHCWGPGEEWVDRFFDALVANRDWLTTTTPSAWLEHEPPVGRIYLPTGSYAEMGEWSLPPEEGRRFSAVLHADIAEGRPEARWLRGGFWRNFQVKYREINDLHKQMLRTSAAVEALPEGPARDSATDHLYRGQSNDCYWHGVFGGIYLSHMRLATLEHLIAAQDICDRQGREQGLPVDGIRSLDADLDGIPELVVTSPGQSIVLKTSEGAGIGTWDIRASRHALASVLRRRPEAYHAKLVELESGAGAHAGEADAAASIHDIVKVREPGLAARLQYDRYERRSGLVHLLPADTTPEAFAAAAATELADLADGRYVVIEATPSEVVLERASEVRTDGLVVPVLATKRFRFEGDRRAPAVALQVTVRSLGEAPVHGRLAVSWSLNLLGGGGNPAAWWEIGDSRVAFDSTGELEDATSISCGNDALGVTVRGEAGTPCGIWWASVDTVSISEDGFERTHQGSGLTFVWPLELAPGEERTVSMRLEVATAFDRASDDPV